MAKRSSNLCWRLQQSGAEWAYSGDLMIGMIGRHDTDKNRWRWMFLDFFIPSSRRQPRRRPPTQGETGSASRSRAAVERSWSAWCTAAALVPDHYGRYRHERPEDIVKFFAAFDVEANEGSKGNIDIIGAPEELKQLAGNTLPLRNIGLRYFDTHEQRDHFYSILARKAKRP